MDRRLAAVAVSRLRLGGGGTPHHTPAAFRSAARREQTFEVAPIIIVDFAEGKLGSEHADAGREWRKVRGTTIAVRRGCSRQAHDDGRSPLNSSRQLVIPLADAIQAQRKPDPLFRRLENDERRGLGGAELT